MILEVNNLKAVYDKKIALENVSFKLEKGDYLAVVGRNGSGKSTLMKTLLGLKSQDEGTINFEKKSTIGYLPQLDESLENFPARVYEIVRTGLLNQMHFPFIYTKPLKNRVNEVMEELNIEKLQKKSFSSLSGGQKQKVLLARALLASKDLLFMDEPTTGLDPVATRDFYSIVDRLNQEGLTVLMITHDVKTAVKCAKSILHLDREMLYFGSKDDYLKTDLFSILSGVHMHD